MPEDVDEDRSVGGCAGGRRRRVAVQHLDIGRMRAGEIGGLAGAVDGDDRGKRSFQDARAGAAAAPHVEHPRRAGELLAGDRVKPAGVRRLTGQARVSAHATDVDLDVAPVQPRDASALVPRLAVLRRVGHFPAPWRTTVVNASRMGASTRMTSSIFVGSFLRLAWVRRPMLNS